MNNKQNFDEQGNRPNDFIDGVTITTLMCLIIAGIIYYLYSM